MIFKTAREHCKQLRSRAFGAYKMTEPGKPAWTKVGGGYIAVTDGTDKGYVAPGLMFAVEVHAGVPVIYSYTRSDGDGLSTMKPYALATIKHLIAKPEIWTKRAMTFESMIALVKQLFPDIDEPTPFQFWAEYGFKYDKDTGNLINFANIIDDPDEV